MAGMMFRFYNGGLKLDTAVHYSLPPASKEDGERNALWRIEAEEKSFFEAPAMIQVKKIGMVVTNLDRTILDKFGPLGVVLVDDREDLMGMPVEKTDKKAKERGDAAFQEYLEDAAQKYLNQVQESKARGLTVWPARDFVKYALKKLNMADPALEVRNFVEKAAETSEVATLKAQMAELLARLGEKPVANAR